MKKKTIKYPCGVKTCDKNVCATVKLPSVFMKLFTFSVMDILQGLSGALDVLMGPFNKIIDAAFKALGVPDLGKLLQDLRGKGGPTGFLPASYANPRVPRFAPHSPPRTPPHMIYCWKDLLPGFNLAGVSGPQVGLGGHGGSSKNGSISDIPRNTPHGKDYSSQGIARPYLKLGVTRASFDGGDSRLDQFLKIAVSGYPK